ncbi:hypothetical protein KAR48_00560 [bacterium]|nr:hypothetical protein [bacterium]
MAGIYYYMTVFPNELLIASMLKPDQFGSYLATSIKTGSHEQLMFVELTGEFGNDFDWAYARKHTVPHENGKLKNSIYLAAYRVLERIPLDKMGRLYMTTPDGRTLGLEQSPFPDAAEEAPYYVYQDLCPVHPLVISSLPLKDFGDYMVSDTFKLSLPALCYCDLSVATQDSVHTGNIGPLYDHKFGHLKRCIEAVTIRGKKTKIMERTFAGRFTYQSVKSGFAFIKRGKKIWYAMPSREVLSASHYDWARSAMII